MQMNHSTTKGRHDGIGNSAGSPAIRSSQ